MQVVARTRDRIVAATTELFRRSGFNGTSLKEITTAAQATTGSLYHFFPGGKDELAGAVIVESGAAYIELFEMIASHAVDAVTAIADFFEGAAELLESTDFIDPCPIGTVAREVASSNDVLRHATDLVFRSWIDTAAAHLEHRCDVETSVAHGLATMLIGALEGAFVLARARRDAEPVRAIGQQMLQLVVLARDGAAASIR